MTMFSGFVAVAVVFMGVRLLIMMGVIVVMPVMGTGPERCRHADRQNVVKISFHDLNFILIAKLPNPGCNPVAMSIPKEKTYL